MTAASSKIREHVTEWAGLAALSAFAAVALRHFTHMPGWAPVVIECAIIIVGAPAAGVLAESGAAGAWAAAFGAWLAGWSAWAEARGVWHAVVVVGWLIGLIVFVPLGAAAFAAAARRRRPARPALEQGPSPEDLARQAELDKWDHMWAEIGFDGIRTLEVTKEPAGRVAEIELPRSGQVTSRLLEEAAPRIEVILHLQPNSVDFTIGSHSGHVIVRLREHDTLARSVPLARQYYARTINNPFPVGISEDGQVISISLREVHGYIVGMTGAGKSNLLNVLIAQMGRCVDTVIWMIDMKGGRVARPWLQPWVNGETDSPVLDWVATTREEAALMMNCFTAAVDTRSNSGMGVTKIIPRADRPQILLLTDEMAVLFSPDRGRSNSLPEGAVTNFEFLEKAITAIQMGRSEACGTIWATQRATNSMAGSNDMKANCKLKILLGVANESEGRYLLNEDRAAQKRAVVAADIAGAGVIQVGKKSTGLVKFFLHDHPVDPASENGDTLCENGCVPECPVRKSAIEAGRTRPKLDLVTTRGLGEDYARRWERAGQTSLLTRAVPVLTAASGEPGDFEAVMEGGGMSDPEADENPIRVRMREILAARGTLGGTPKMLTTRLAEEGLSVTRETVQRWLASDEEAGYVHRARYGLWQIGQKADDAA